MKPISLSLKTTAPWIAFLGALAVYWLTVEPGASLWDCPEYIDGALRLEIGHPPGNPTWLLLHRIVSLFGLSQSGAILAINMASGFFTAWGVGLLCACSQRVLRLLIKDGWAISLASLSGALCFGWADSPWFSAVEAEVYAMSLWMTALCVWLMLKWMAERNPARRWNYIFLVAYIIGLSIGVHQLTLLVIPALAMIVCYRQVGIYRKARGRQWLAALAGVGCVAVILFGMMKWIPRRLGSLELLAVNGLGLSYHSGVIFGWIFFIILLFVSGILISNRKKRLLSGIIWCVFFLSVGFSSYALIIIRASAQPPMNQGDPSDIFSFITYIDRDQYGGAPLLYGSTPESRPLKREHIRISQGGDTIRSYYGHVRIKERPYYSKAVTGARIGNSAQLFSEDELKSTESLALSGRDRYLLTGYKMKLRMIPELEMWLPRLHSSNPSDVAAYEDWTGMNRETMKRVRISEAADSAGNPVPKRGPDGKPVEATGLRPTFLQNLTMLFGYQSGYMYFRYLLWNFSGRQNDIHSTGEVEHGNFITGFTRIDNLMLGAEESLPLGTGGGNPGRNRYWMLPLLFGFAGLTWLCIRGRSGRRIAGVSIVLFLMTGLAIVLYLNQTPGEPRERDYSFLGSFWVFGFWIATGMGAFSLFISKILRIGTTTRKIITAVFSLGLPFLMLSQNYDDHNRSGRYPADEYASLVLESLPEGTILFTMGDNHTFPLWYARNARGVRRDVSVINVNYLQLPWQVVQAMNRDEVGRTIPMTMTLKDVAYGAVSAIRIGRDTLPVDAVEALKRLYSDTAAVPELPSSRLLIGRKNPVVFDIRERYGIEPGGIMNLKQLALLDIVTTNAVSAKPRPIAWHSVLNSKGSEGWAPFTVPLTFARLWSPDSAYSSEASRKAILSVRPLQKPGGRYIDPVYGGMISWQRMAIMTEARRALEEGDTAMARNILQYIVSRFPFDEWQPMLKGFSGETIDEAILFPDLAEKTGILPSLADSLRHVASERRREWRRYYEALPSGLRKAMTPASRRLATESNN